MQCGCKKIKVKQQGAYNLKGWTGICCIGPLHLHIKEDTWNITDITDPCDIEIDTVSDLGIPRKLLYSFDLSKTFNNELHFKGKVDKVKCVMRNRCLQLIDAKNIHEWVVSQWAPFSQLIYTHVDNEKQVVLPARIDHHSTIHCLFCKKTFARSTEAFMTHTGLKGNICKNEFKKVSNYIARK